MVLLRLDPSPVSRVSDVGLERRGTLDGAPLPDLVPGSLRKLRTAVRQADLVQLHDTLYLGNLFAGWQADRAGRPLLITQHVGELNFRTGSSHEIDRVREPLGGGPPPPFRGSNRLYQRCGAILLRDPHAVLSPPPVSSRMASIWHGFSPLRMTSAPNCERRSAGTRHDRN